MINAQTRIIIAFAAGACVGGGIGYIVAERKVRRETEAEIAAVKDLFRRFRDEEKEQESVHFDSSPVDEEEVIDEITAEGLAEKAVSLGYIGSEDSLGNRKNPNYLPPTPQEPGDEELSAENDPDLEKEVDYVRRISNNPMHEPDPDDVTAWDRSPDHPYVITEAEYRIDRLEYEKLSLNFYRGDEVLTEANEVYIPDRNGTVGDDNLEFFGLASGDENLLHVRNDRVMADFEVTLNEGSYAHVIGFNLDEPKLRDSKRPIKRMRNRD